MERQRDWAKPEWWDWQQLRLGELGQRWRCALLVKAPDAKGIDGFIEWARDENQALSLRKATDEMGRVDRLIDDDPPHDDDEEHPGPVPCNFLVTYASVLVKSGPALALYVFGGEDRERMMFDPVDTLMECLSERWPEHVFHVVHENPRVSLPECESLFDSYLLQRYVGGKTPEQPLAEEEHMMSKTTSQAERYLARTLHPKPEYACRVHFSIGEIFNRRERFVWSYWLPKLLEEAYADGTGEVKVRPFDWGRVVDDIRAVMTKELDDAVAALTLTREWVSEGMKPSTE